MNKFFERIFGITKIREEANAAAQEALQVAEDAKNAAIEAVEEARKAEEEARKAAEEEALAKMTPKDRATAKGEPWVSVLDTHVNKENLRNGFFELDWNDIFINQLRTAGYGLDGDPDEDVVDRWFRELCANVVVGGGFDDYGPIDAGSIDGANINSSKENS